jgi:hypothetical protein
MFGWIRKKYIIKLNINQVGRHYDYSFISFVPENCVFFRRADEWRALNEY